VLTVERQIGGDYPDRARDGVAAGAVRPSVCIVSDVRLLRDGLTWQLEKDGRLDVRGSARPDGDGLQMLCAERPDAVVLDLGVPSGLAFVQRLRADLPQARIIGYAIADSGSAIAEWARTGVCGYVEREGDESDIVTTVFHAMRGELYCSPRFAARLLAQVANQAPPQPDDLLDKLTPRERQILQFLGQGRSNKEIARTLGISVATVKNHVHNLLEKLSLDRRSQASAVLRGSRYNI
jgi:two-component system nitrate/nitrite response regulator NarL